MKIIENVKKKLLPPSMTRVIFCPTRKSEPKVVSQWSSSGSRDGLQGH